MAQNARPEEAEGTKQFYLVGYSGSPTIGDGVAVVASGNDLIELISLIEADYGVQVRFLIPCPDAWDAEEAEQYADDDEDPIGDLEDE